MQSILLIILIIISILNSPFIISLYNKMAKSKDKTTELDSNRNLFERKYYKDISTDKVVKLLEEWLSYLFDIKAIENINLKKFNNLMSKTVLYCSTTTIELLSEFQQFNYKGINENEPRLKHSNEFLFLLSLLISSIKYDFTNEYINPIKLIKIKIKDIKTIENDLNKYEKKYKKYINKMVK